MRSRTGILRRLSGLAPALALAVLLLASPEPAQACSVCSAAEEDSVRAAFLVTTVFLSVLPLMLVGGFAWWLRRRVRDLDAEREEPSPTA